NGSVAFSADGTLLASPGREEAASEPTVKVWDSQTHKVQYILKGHVRYVWKVAFSPKDPKRPEHRGYLASGSWDSTIKIWDLGEGEISTLGAFEPPEPVVTLRGHAGYVYGLAFSPDGSRLASASGHAGNGEVKIWDATLWKNKANEKK